MIISRSVLLRMKNVSGKNCRENQNTHFVFTNFFFFNRDLYEVMWKNVVQAGRPKMKRERMRFGCWILKGTNTCSKYEVHFVFSLQQWLRERASILLSYVQHIVCVVHFIIKLYDCWSVRWRSSAGRQEIKVRAVHRFWHWMFKWIKKQSIKQSIIQSVIRSLWFLVTILSRCFVDDKVGIAESEISINEWNNIIIITLEVWDCLYVDYITDSSERNTSYKLQVFTNVIPTRCIRDSSVDIATRKGLDGHGIKSRWGRDFSHSSRPALGPT